MASPSGVQMSTHTGRLETPQSCGFHESPNTWGGSARLFLLFFVCPKSGPDGSRQPSGFIWTKFQPKRSTLDPIRAIFVVLGPNRHCRPNLDLQDQARDWPGGPAGPAGILFFVLTNKQK